MTGTIDQAFQRIADKWGWLLALGILFLILGIIGLGMEFWLTLVGVYFFGVLLLIGAGAQLAHAFTSKGWRSILPHGLIAVVYALAGFLIFSDPVAASAALTLVLALFIFAAGVLRIIMALQLRPASGWGWVLVLGIASVILGAMIGVQWPASGLWFIGMIIAIELIFQGWALIMVALAARRFKTV